MTVDPNANLSLAIEVDDTTPSRFQPIAITLRVLNAIGGAQASNILVQLTLPPNLTFGGSTGPAGSFDPATMRWSLPLLDSGSNAEIVITALLDSSLGGKTLVFDAGILSATQPDPIALGNTAAMLATVTTETVELVRDGFGIPHIFSTSDHGAYFGAGVAMAEDRLSQMIALRLSFDGRLAQLFGRGKNDKLLDSDRRARLYGFRHQAMATAANLDPELRSLLNAFVEGVNSVLNGGVTTLHPFFQAAFITAGVSVDPWTVTDTIASWSYTVTNFGPSALTEAMRLHSFEALLASLGGDFDAALMEFTTPAVLDDSAAAVTQSDVPLAIQQAMADYATSLSLAPDGRVLNIQNDTAKFSQAWVFSGARSADSKSVLVTDPRLPLGRPSAQYELHMKGETFEVHGVTLPGSVNVLMGQSGSMVWGASALGVDQEDLFRLTVDPINEQGKYELDGVYRPFEFQQIEVIQILGEAAVVETYRETVFGPVVTPVVTDVNPGEEYAVRRVDTAEFGDDSSLGFLRMYRAADVDEFDAALEYFRAPSANMVFGDSAGRIGYRTNGAMPVRSPTQPFAPLTGRLAQAGNLSSGDWIDLVPHPLKPAVLDPAAGFLMTANHMPVGSWYPIPIKAGTGSTGETARSYRLRELLEGLPTVPSRDQVFDPHFDIVNAPQRDFIALAALAKRDLGTVYSTDAEAALVEAEAWLNATTLAGEPGDKNNVHRGVALVNNLDLVVRSSQSEQIVTNYGGGTAGTIAFLKQKRAELALTGTVTLAAFEIAYIDSRLATAWQSTDNQFGAEVNWLAGYDSVVQTLNTPAWQLLGQPALDPLDVVSVGPLLCVDGDTLLSQGSQSYTLRAVGGDVDAGIAVFPFGQAEPGKQHESDQTSLFENQTFRATPMTKAAISSLVGPVVQTDLVF